LPQVRLGGLILADHAAIAQDYFQTVPTYLQLDTLFLGRFAITLKKR
jgi:hypothetical protein